MFFDSLLRRKQGVFNPSSPSVNSLTTSRQVYIMNPGNKNEMEPKVPTKKIIINRSKSEQQFNKNGLGGHTKHPILQKQRNHHPSENVNFQQIIQQNSRVIESVTQSRNRGCEKVGRNQQVWKSNQKLVDFREYDMKGLSRVSNYCKIKQSRDFIENPNPFIALPPNYIRQALGHSSRKSQLQSPHNSNFFVKRKSSQQVQILSPFNIDQHQNHLLEEETTKQSHTEGENNIRGIVKNLQKQMEFIQQERDKDKVNIQCLKLQNEKLKKNTRKSKQNIDVKIKDKIQVFELKKLLKQEGDNRECIQRQRQTVLKQLNETLIAHEAEKLKWQKQKKQFNHKIQNLLLQVKDRKNQNLLLTQKINFICGENRKLRETNQNMQRDVQQKQKEVVWVNLKVNDLKEALQNLKIHGNSRIQKLQLQLKQVEKKRKQQNPIQLKNMEKRFREQQKEIRQQSLLIEELSGQIKTYQHKIQQTDQQVTQYRYKLEQLQKSKNEEIRKIELKINECQYTQKIMKAEVNQLYDKLNQAQLAMKKLKSQKEIMESIIKEGNDKITNLLGEISRTKKQLTIKQTEIETIQNKLKQVQRQSLFQIAELKNKNIGLQNQLSALNAKLKQMVANSAQMTGQKARRKSEEQSTNKIVYSQLQMRMCSSLGIYLTSNIEKIMGPVDEMIKARKYLQANSKSYEELLRIFEVREGGHNRLISQMREYKSNYHGILNFNYQLQSQNVRLKEENSYFGHKLQQASYFSKKLESMLENSNETTVKLRLRLQNDKYSATGTKKC